MKANSRPWFDTEIISAIQKEANCIDGKKSQSLKRTKISLLPKYICRRCCIREKNSYLGKKFQMPRGAIENFEAAIKTTQLSFTLGKGQTFWKRLLATEFLKNSPIVSNKFFGSANKCYHANV